LSTEPQLTLTVSVVIPTYRRPYGLPTVVQPHIDDPAVLEVVIVDDGSGDSTEAVCQDLARQSPKVKIVSQSNQGEAAARMAGARAAQGELLLVLDDDVIARQGLAGAHADEQLASASNTVLIGYMPPITRQPRRADDYPVYVYAKGYERACSRYEEHPQSILEHLWGGHFSVRRELFLACENIDQSLPYHQDQELGWLLAKHGGVGVFNRSLRADHDVRRSPEQFLRDSRRRGAAIAQLTASGHTVDHPLARLPAPAAKLVNVLASPAAAPARALVRAALSAAGMVHLWSAQTELARLLRLVELQIGYNEVLRSTGTT
jgi:glycosyltransferase involved in cell wall biosynthesis